MLNELGTLIQKRLDELPQDVRQAIESADLHARISDIGAEHKLHIDQIGALEDETLLVMLGFSDPAEFPDQLQKRLNIGAEEAALIANNTNEEVFQTIRDSMRTFMEARAEEKFVAPPPSAPPQVTEGITPSPLSFVALAKKEPPPALSVPKPPPAPPKATQGTALPIPPKPSTPPAPGMNHAVPARPAPAKPPLNPLGAIQEKLSAPSISPAKPFDLSLKNDKPSALPAPAAADAPPPKKNYAKDPYRESVE